MIVKRCSMFLVAALWGCGDKQEQDKQEQTRVLADYPAASRVPGATVLPGSYQQDSYEFELGGRSVPLTLEWDVARDAEGCLRPARVRVQRVGGDPRLVIDSVWVDERPCEATETDSIREGSAMVLARAHTRNGISSARGDLFVGRLVGRGRFIGWTAR
jgi:hypothetical protein